MVNCVSVLGSTGSVGRQTLDIVEHLHIPVAALTAGTNAERMAQQCRQFRPALAVMASREAAEQLKKECLGRRWLDSCGNNAPGGLCHYRCGGYVGTKAHAGSHPGKKTDRTCQ